MTDRENLPRCCEYRGLFYPGHIKRCRQHATPEQRALAAETEDRAAALGVLAGQGWPYGPNIDVESRLRLLDWADANGLRLANTRCQGLHWLTRGRCAVRICNRLGHWMDHVTRWNWGGRPALILAQPYHLTGDCEAQLGQLAADGLRVSVGDDGWYGWGTVAVEVWDADVYRRHLLAG
ncbi:hypothetical protein GCM10011608_10900 [Micromonospora sonchi]|uniref:Uncharacterized protein n=1 Tax=Micromonospora sonchi TaxID=1763543 RepID=A0A917WSK1_9ACTN|nr:hypothetical protein [Micromonospora sonchi]GGM27890.1 hypothetical protein GCM10011608_10900 [Micromonospora sonchi]